MLRPFRCRFFRCCSSWPRFGACWARWRLNCSSPSALRRAGALRRTVRCVRVFDLPPSSALGFGLVFTAGLIGPPSFPLASAKGSPSTSVPHSVRLRTALRALVFDRPPLQRRVPTGVSLIGATRPTPLRRKALPLPLTRLYVRWSLTSLYLPWPLGCLYDWPLVGPHPLARKGLSSA